MKDRYQWRKIVHDAANPSSEYGGRQDKTCTQYTTANEGLMTAVGTCVIKETCAYSTHHTLSAR